MSWTQGQPSRANQSPYIDPVNDSKNQKPPASNNYTRPNTQNYNQRQPSSPPRSQQPRDNVAATFTQEGLQTFSSIFSSTVEAAIQKSLPDIVESAIERKMQDVLNQAKLEIQQFTSEFLLHILQNAQTVIEKRFNELIDAHLAKPTEPGLHLAEPDEASLESKSEVVIEPAAVHPETTAFDGEALEASLPAQEAASGPFETSSSSFDATSESSEIGSKAAETQNEVSSETPTVSAPVAAQNAAGSSETRITRAGRRMNQELESLLQALMSVNRPVKTSELPSLVEDIEWGSNPSIKMSALINKSNGKIERIGRGLYRYMS